MPNEDEVVKETIPIVEADAGVLRHIRLYVLTGVSIAFDAAPTEEQVGEVVADLLANDERFAKWPLDNKKGLQSTFLEIILAAATEKLMGPIAPEPGVVEAYVDPGTRLPEVDQESPGAEPGTVVAEKAERDEDEVPETDSDEE